MQCMHLGPKPILETVKAVSYPLSKKKKRFVERVGSYTIPQLKLYIQKLFFPQELFRKAQFLPSLDTSVLWDALQAF